MEQQGLIARRFYSDHPPRVEYYLTDKGKSWAVLKALRDWGQRYLHWVPSPDRYEDDVKAHHLMRNLEQSRGELRLANKGQNDGKEKGKSDQAEIRHSEAMGEALRARTSTVSCLITQETSWSSILRHAPI